MKVIRRAVQNEKSEQLSRNYNLRSIIEMFKSSRHAAEYKFCETHDSKKKLCKSSLKTLQLMILLELDRTSFKSTVNFNISSSMNHRREICMTAGQVGWLVKLDG